MKKSDWTVYIPDGFGGLVEMDYFESLTRTEAKDLANRKWGKGCTLVALRGGSK